MPLLIVVLVFLAVTGLIVGIVLLSQHFDKKRTEALQAVAAELGMQFSGKADANLLSKLQVFTLFNQGHSRKMKNVMTAETEAVRLSLFDYRYTTGGGKNAHTHSLSVVAMEFATLHLPNFTIRPEGFLDAIGSALGLQDIDFVEDPTFSKAFVLKGSDEAGIRSFFNAELRNALTEHRGCHMESAANMFIFRQGGQKTPAQMRGLMEAGFKIYASFANRQPQPPAVGNE